MTNTSHVSQILKRLKVKVYSILLWLLKNKATSLTQPSWYV